MRLNSLKLKLSKSHQSGLAFMMILQQTSGLEKAVSLPHPTMLTFDFIEPFTGLLPLKNQE
jgi:hypothetical protein